jgi:hypothetical protein
MYRFDPKLIPIAKEMSVYSGEELGLALALLCDRFSGIVEKGTISGWSLNLSQVSSGRLLVWAWSIKSNPINSGGWFDASVCDFELGEIRDKKSV